MGVFGFIENFFFISLGIAFALILLLVYHFKNRMSVAEKKSETMYGLLSSVVKEIKSLRNMFGVTPPAAVVPEVPVSKSTPEVAVEMKEVIHVDLNRSSSSSNSNKIVVSDEEDSEEDEEDSDTSSESGSESESESESEDDDDELSVEDLTPVEPVQEPVLETEQEPEPVELSVEETLEQIHAQDQELSSSESQIHTQDQELPSSEPEDTKQKYTVDQLKKMNINQLKTISIQSGIETDISKLKKHDLITLILEKTQ